MSDVENHSGKSIRDRISDPGRLTDLAILFCLFALLLSQFVLIAVLPNALEHERPIGGAALSILIWMAFSLLMVSQLIRVAAVSLQTTRLSRIKPEHRSDKDNRQLGRGFLESILYLIVSMLVMTIIAFLSTSKMFSHVGLQLAHSASASADPVHIVSFTSFIVLSFVPPLLGAYLHSKASTEARGVKLFRNDVVSWETVIWTGIVALMIVGLAWAAGDRLFEIKNDLGIFVTLFVISIFLLFIIGPHLTRAWELFQDNRTKPTFPGKDSVVQNGIALHPVAALSYVDSFLVRIVAPLSGVTQRSWMPPHAVLLALIIPLSGLGYVLSSPFGLIPIAFAVLIALALGRRWSWIEEDCDTASRLQRTETPEIHIGFENDIKDETLLAYASLFILVPLALFQIQEWIAPFEVKTDLMSGNAFFDWLRFFGAELAKGVPFVDWWEIYNVDVEVPYVSEGEKLVVAKHLTFAARAMVDLVIMAALLQAVSIWQRHRTQNKFYDSGHLDAFDPFAEKRFFEKGVSFDKHARSGHLKSHFKQRVKDHAKSREILGLPRLPYSKRRISELKNTGGREVKFAINWMIEEFGILAGTALEQMRLIPMKWGVQPENADAFLIKLENKTQRERKLEFEQIISELTSDIRGESPNGRVAVMTDRDFSLVLDLLRHSRSLPEFQFGEILCVEMLAATEKAVATLTLANLVLDENHLNVDRPRHAELVAAARRMNLQEGGLRFGQAPMRARVYEAIFQIGKARKAIIQEGFGDPVELELLSWMGSSDGDSAASGRDEASKRARELEKFYTNA